MLRFGDLRVEKKAENHDVKVRFRFVWYPLYDRNAKFGSASKQCKFNDASFELDYKIVKSVKKKKNYLTMYHFPQQFIRITSEGAFIYNKDISQINIIFFWVGHNPCVQYLPSYISGFADFMFEETMLFSFMQIP